MLCSLRNIKTSGHIGAYGALGRMEEVNEQIKAKYAKLVEECHRWGGMLCVCPLPGYDFQGAHSARPIASWVYWGM